METRNRAFIITGGSRGLGAALGEQLAHGGARVVLVARGSDALHATVEHIRSGGGEAHGIPADIGDKHAIHRIVGEAAALVGPIDGVIHAASTLGPTPLRELLDTECEDLERVLAVNLVGSFRLTKAVAGGMIARGRGIIVHISSDAAVEAYSRWGAYGASKAAQDQLSAIWAEELGPTGVRVLAVDPGEMDTRMHAEAMPDADRALLADPHDIARRIVAMIRDDTNARSGSRLVAPTWEVQP